MLIGSKPQGRPPPAGLHGTASSGRELDFFANRFPEGWIYFIVLRDLVMAPTGTEKEGPELQKGQVLLVSHWDLHHQPCHASHRDNAHVTKPHLLHMRGLVRDVG